VVLVRLRVLRGRIEKESSFGVGVGVEVGKDAGRADTSELPPAAQYQRRLANRQTVAQKDGQT
jgi:hypothetical protein